MLGNVGTIVRWWRVRSSSSGTSCARSITQSKSFLNQDVRNKQWRIRQWKSQKKHLCQKGRIKSWERWWTGYHCGRGQNVACNGGIRKENAFVSLHIMCFLELRDEWLFLSFKTRMLICVFVVGNISQEQFIPQINPIRQIMETTKVYNSFLCLTEIRILGIQVRKRKNILSKLSKKA